MKKMLLMGSPGVGKTSMHRVIFANVPAKETKNIGYTRAQEEHRITIMGNLELNLWDCGFQDKFMREYFNQKRETIFSRVQVLLYVFDSEENEEDTDTSLNNFKETLHHLRKFSPESAIFVLIHKIDLIPELQRQKLFGEKKKKIQQVAGLYDQKINSYYATTIWDQSLYQAWSNIVQFLIPDRQFMADTLKRICETCGCKEALFFQKSTFLLLSHFTTQKSGEMAMFERLSLLLKTLKITCRKAGGKVQQIEIKTSNFSSLILQFTPTTSIMLISNLPLITDKQICQLNLSIASKHFLIHRISP